MKHLVSKTILALATIVAVMWSADIQAQSVNMSRYITLTVESGQEIQLDFKTVLAGTPVRIISGSNTLDITVGTSWADYQTYTAGSSTMTIYGDITGFKCSDNGTKLTALDVSKNTALKELYCSQNKLTSLNLNNNTALKELYCSQNQLTSLDVSQNKDLKELVCHTNQLASLDLSQNTALTHLYCYNNQLTSLNVRNNTSLTYLYCNNNRLTSLDVSNNATLTYLSCNNNSLNTLNVSSNNALQNLICQNNQISTIDLSNNIALKWFECYSNRLTSLDVSNNTALMHLLCNDNQLTSLNVGQNSQLKKIYCFDNQLTSLDVSNNTALRYLYCYNNKLTTINLGGCTDLMELYCYNNQLTSLNIDKNNQLKQLDCSINQLTTLNVNNNTDLFLLYCHTNQLTSLDLSNNVQLNLLACFGNRFEACDLDKIFDILPTRETDDNAKIYIKDRTSTNPGADGCRTPIAKAKNWKVLDWNGGNESEIENTDFTCSYISLTVQDGEQIQLDLKADVANTPISIVCGNNTIDTIIGTSWTGSKSYTTKGNNIIIYGNIAGLKCSENGAKLTAIDVNNNKGLKELYCLKNQITSLDVANNTALIILACSGNRLTSLNVSNNTNLMGLYCADNQLTALDISKNTLLGELNCGNNPISTLDISNNTRLTYLECSKNSLTSLDVTNNSLLNTLYCDGNLLSDCALDSLFNSLPARESMDYARVIIKDGTSTNPGTKGCRTPIAKSKNWRVTDYNNGGTELDINNTSFTCTTSDLIETEQSVTVSLYPNPVENVLHIEAEGEILSVRIYNTHGAEVATAAAGTKQINLTHLPAGIYAVRIETAKGVSTQRVVKK